MPGPYIHCAMRIEVPAWSSVKVKNHMAERAAGLGFPAKERLHALVVPREHGAWGMLLVPLLTGASVGLLRGGHWLPLLPLTVMALALFWMRTPVESWLGTTPLRAQTETERRAASHAILALGAVAGLALAALLWGRTRKGLLLLGAVAGAAFVVQAGLKKLGRKTRMAAQVAGALGLTATAPAAYYVVTGQFDLQAYSLWLANWLFAGEQIHFVQLRIRAARAASRGEKLARGRIYLAGQILLVCVLWLAWRLGLVPGLALVAFVPVFVRGMTWFVRRPRALAVRRLGWTELGHAVAFGILLTVGFHLGR